MRDTMLEDVAMFRDHTFIIDWNVRNKISARGRLSTSPNNKNNVESDLGCTILRCPVPSIISPNEIPGSLRLEPRKIFWHRKTAQKSMATQKYVSSRNILRYTLFDSFVWGIWEDADFNPFPGGLWRTRFLAGRGSNTPPLKSRKWSKMRQSANDVR